MRAQAYTRMNEGWEAPPELMGPLPRKTQWTKRGKTNRWFAAFVAGFGFLIVLGVLGNAMDYNQLKTEAKEVEGSVTRKWIDHRKGIIYHYVAYSFAVGGQTFRGEGNIPGAKWRKLSIGSVLVVQYVPWRPSNNRPAIAFESLALPYWVPLGVFAGWIGFIYLALMDVRREKALLMYGQPAAGLIVTDNRGTRRPKYGWVTRYEFQVQDGSMRKGRVQRDRTWMKGQTVCILYDPKRPRRSGIYPMRMVEIPTEIMRDVQSKGGNQWKSEV